MQKILKSF